MGVRVRILMAAAVFGVLAAGAVAEEPKAGEACEKSCAQAHKDTVKVCLRNHDPVVRGQCMEAAATRLKACLDNCRPK